jgi:hypothetical protein
MASTPRISARSSDSRVLVVDKTHDTCGGSRFSYPPANRSLPVLATHLVQRDLDDITLP